MANKSKNKLSGSILANHLALSFNENLKDEPYYRTNLKNALTKANFHLIKAEKHLDIMLSVEEEGTEVMSGRLISFIDKVVKSDLKKLFQLMELTEALDKKPELRELILDALEE